MNDKELLNYAVENGIISISDIQKQIEMNERKRFINMHSYSIWQGNDKKYYTYLPDERAKRGKRLVKRTTEQSLYDEIVRFYKEQDNEPYIETVYREWIDKKLEYGEIEKQTKDRYETDFKRFFGGSHISEIKFRFITEDDLEHFIRTTIHDKELSSKSWGNLRTLLNGIFKYGRKRGYTNISITAFMGDLDLSSKVFKKVIHTPQDQVFTKKEEQMIISSIKKDEVSLLGLGVMLAFQTGLRAGELAALTWDDIQDDSISITKTEIRFKNESGRNVRTIRNIPKTPAGFRHVYLTDEAKRIISQIKEINPNSNYIFVKDGKRMHGHLFTKKLYRICNNLGLQPRSLHKARKTYATKLIDAAVPDSMIKDQMGHEDIETTKRYYYFNSHSREEVKTAITRALNA